MSEWFEQWFGEEYLRLYPHRDAEDAERAVAFVARVAPLAGRRVLDLACGPGRHAERLAARGAATVGFDLSLPLLARARQRLGREIRLVRGDMRHLPFAPHAFDHVVNLFTSFGYFAHDAQHQQVLDDIATVLRPGGRLVLDYLNAARVQATLVAREEREAGRQRVRVERRITPDGRFVEKAMHLEDDGRRFIERVRLFTGDELAAMCRAAGLVEVSRHGDYDGAAAAPAAPRTILVAERP